VPVVVLAMVPALQFRDWQWLSLALAAPVAVWGAWPFHRAALVNARHRAATMDTLISVGVTAAFAWSLCALFFTGAGMPGMRMSFTLLAEHAGTAGIYLDAAAGVTVLILLGRYFEARAKRRSGAALRALASLAAKDAVVLRDGRETRIPVARLAVGDLFVVRPGEKIAADGVGGIGQLCDGHLDAHRRASTRGSHRRGRGDRRLRERQRPADGPRHPGRRRH
jgi:Cu+-exporting ATPase